MPLFGAKPTPVRLTGFLEALAVVQIKFGHSVVIRDKQDPDGPFHEDPRLRMPMPIACC